MLLTVVANVHDRIGDNLHIVDLNSSFRTLASHVNVRCNVDHQ